MNMNMSMAWHVLNKFHEHEHKHGMAFKGEAAAQQVLQCSSNGAQEEKIKSRIPTAAAMDRDETKMRGKQRFEANRVASVMLCKCKCTCK